MNSIRSALGYRPRHAPHDPFAVDAGRAVDAMKIAWNDSYYIKACAGGYEAVRRHGPRVTLTAPTPDDLTRAMTDDSGSW